MWKLVYQTNKVDKLYILQMTPGPNENQTELVSAPVSRIHRSTVIIYILHLVA